MRKFERYCKDITKVENYEKAVAVDFKGWVCHHKLELIATGGVVDVDRQDLIDWGIYYNRPEDELIFLTRAEHNKIHHTGKKRSAETKRKMSDALTGRVGSMTGHTQSEETRRKISEAMKKRMI